MRLASRLIWFHCPTYSNADLPEEEKELDAARALLEKKTMLNLLEAFPVALKHYLRGESGIHYEDLYHLIVFLPKVRHALPFSERTDPNVLNACPGGCARSINFPIVHLSADMTFNTQISLLDAQHSTLPAL